MDDDAPIVPEADLIRRAQAGDEEAARTLFERHVADLRRRVHRGLPSLARGKLAESDVIQEAYLTAFVRLADFEDRGEGSFGRWLTKILDNKIRHEARRYLGTTKRAAPTCTRGASVGPLIPPGGQGSRGRHRPAAGPGAWQSPRPWTTRTTYPRSIAGRSTLDRGRAVAASCQRVAEAASSTASTVASLYSTVSWFAFSSTVTLAS